jgi:L-cysteine S-thiosulfotransferase
MTRRSLALHAAIAAALLVAFVPTAPAQVADFTIVGDGIPKSLTGKPGVPARGRALLAARGTANCLDCHVISDRELPEGAKGGSKGPALDGVGARLTSAQLRLSVVDYARLAPKVPMPSFHKPGARPAGDKEDPARPLLDAQQIEDVVAYLASLRL